MTPEQKNKLKTYGENTAYAAKCHFKSADLRRLGMQTFIVITVILPICTVVVPCNYHMNSMLASIIAASSLVASSFLYIYQSKNEQEYIPRHMESGEEYLKVHYDVHDTFTSETVSDTDITSLKERIKLINERPKPPVMYFAKLWAKYSIEKQGEMKTWWK